MIDSLFDSSRLIEPAIVDVDGNVTEAFKTEMLISMNEEQLEKLKTTAFLVANIRIHTPESKFVRLLSSYKLYNKITGDLITDVDLNQ